MNKGELFASKVLNECGLVNPLDMSLEDIIFSRGANYKEEPLNGAQGRIVIEGKHAVITCDSNISLIGKKRFTMAHELGHFEMHKELFSIHSDNEISLNDWNKKDHYETQANQFAAEFLMPKVLYKSEIDGKPFNISLIKEIAKKFQTSITSTLFRYKDLGNYPIAMIFCEDGDVKWSMFSDDFVLQFIPRNEKVPINTVANDFFSGDNLPKDPELVEAIDWFSSDFNIERYKDWNFHEQCFQVGKKSIFSCLWGY